MAGELIVNTNDQGDLYSMNGEVAPNLSLPTLPTIGSQEASQIALQAVAKWYRKAPDKFIASTPTLWIFDESLEFSIAIIISLILLLLSLKYLISNSNQLQNIFLAIMAFPMILYFIFSIRYDIGNLNYGGYIMTVSFIALYIMAVYDIFKNRNVKKQSINPNK